MNFFNNKFVTFSTRNFLYTLKNSSGGQWEENHLYYCDPGVCPCHARESVGEDYLVSFSQDRKGNGAWEQQFRYYTTTKGYITRVTQSISIKIILKNIKLS